MVFNVGVLASVAIGGRGRWRHGRRCQVNNQGQIATYGGRPRRDQKHRRRWRQRQHGGGPPTLSPGPNIPAISISVATGGAGGSGSTGGTVTSIIRPDHHGRRFSIGVMAQSIGGGGGTGGDSTAASMRKAYRTAFRFRSPWRSAAPAAPVATAAVSITNEGTIATLGGMPMAFSPKASAVGRHRWRR